MMTIITRKKEREAQQAIDDLLARGGTIDYPLTEIRHNGTARGVYDYRKSRYTSVQGMATSAWICRMKKEG